MYFARPDTRLYGRSVHFARVRQGELLAEQAPVEADMVMGVPESGIPAAEGYARASGIPYGQGLVKNRYIGRTFIAPSQEMRALGVRMKLNPLKENLAGKRVVVVDDSVVRGTTQKQLVKMLREAGVTEVHLRLTSPPIKWSCFYGIDTGERRASCSPPTSTVDEIRDYLNVDSLAYITLDRLVDVHRAPAARASATPASPASTRSTVPVDAAQGRARDRRRDGRRRLRSVAGRCHHAGAVRQQPAPRRRRPTARGDRPRARHGEGPTHG